MSPLYPALHACAALRSPTPTTYATWTAARRRAWDRRRTHAAIYLHSYPPPTHPPRLRTRWTLAEHLRFLSALQLPLPRAPTRWAAISVLLPGRVGADVRRYFHRVGRAGLITTAGRLRRRLIARARVEPERDGGELLVSRNPVFLRRCLRKFVPDRLPSIDDAPLRLPEPGALPEDALTYRPPDGRDAVQVAAVRQGVAQSERSAQSLPAALPKSSSRVIAPDAPAVSAQKPATEKLDLPNSGPARQRESVNCQPKRIANAAQPEIREDATRVVVKLRVKRSGLAAKKLHVSRRDATVEQGEEIITARLLSPARGKGGPVRGRNVPDVSDKIHSGFSSPKNRTVVERARKRVPNPCSAPVVKPGGELAKECSAVHSSRKGTVTEVAGQCVHNPNSENLKEHQFESKSLLKERHSAARPKKPSSENHRVPSLDCEALHNREEDQVGIPMTALMPTSRRLYGPLRHLGLPANYPGDGIKATGSRAVTQKDSVPKERCPTCLNLSDTPVSAIGEEETQPTIPESGENGTCSACHSTKNVDNSFQKTLQQPNIALEPFRADESISLWDPDESIVNSRAQGLESNNSTPGATALDAVPETSRELLTLNECNTTLQKSSGRNKRTSISFLLCDTEGDTKVETVRKKQRTEKVLDCLHPNPDNFCCGHCRIRYENENGVEVYRILSGENISDTRLWFLPQMGIVWTRAWVNRHWDARLPVHTLREARRNFSGMQERSKLMYELLKIFGRMTDTVGERLGHVRERLILLRDFEAMHTYVAAEDALSLQNVSGTSRTCPLSVVGATKQFPLSRWMPEVLIAEHIEMDYEEMVSGLTRRWDEVLTNFLQRMNEMEERQTKEVEAQKSIQSIMGI